MINSHARSSWRTQLRVDHLAVAVAGLMTLSVLACSSSRPSHPSGFVEVVGEMRAVGGPYIADQLHPNRPEPGAIALVSTNGHERYTATANRDGIYSLWVKPGSYVAHGWSSASHVGDGLYNCSSTTPTTVVRLTQIDVICGEN